MPPSNDVRRVLRRLRKATPVWLDIIDRLGRGGATRLIPERVWLRSRHERAAATSLGIHLERRGWANAEDLSEALDERYGVDLYLLLQARLGFEPITPASLEDQRQQFVTRLFEAMRSAQVDFGISEDALQPLKTWITTCTDELMAEIRRRDNEQALLQAIRALTFLDDYRERGDSLALFAARALGDSHALDPSRKRPASHYFLWALKFWKDGLTSPPRKMGVEEYDLLLDSKGLARSPLRSAVTVAGVDSDDPMMAGARQRGHVLTIPLQTLKKLGSARAARDKVYVVENPNVLHELVRRLKYAQLPGIQWPTLICGSGYGSLALWRLLDKLMEIPETMLFYSGDRDPHGIAIEHQMRSRYSPRVKRWGDTRTSEIEEMAVDALWSDLTHDLHHDRNITAAQQEQLLEAGRLFAISDQ